MSELDEQRAHRIQKRRELEQLGLDAFPRRFDHDAEPVEVHRTFGETTAEELEAEPPRLRVPGRVRAIRSHGKTSFLDLSDGAEKLQIMVRKKDLDETGLSVLEHLDLGDYLGVEGGLMRTRTGELTLRADSLTLLSKALRPMPEKWHGLADVEARYRQRYLDLMSNPESRGVFEARAAIIRGLRTFLEAHGFLEVETPMMHSIAGGATARPFKTHHNALDLELFLRIAPELFLKRLLVGGLHRVYEINRNFRNEGISVRHNPEFTMLEFYWAYADYRQMMDFTEEMLAEVARSVVGGEELSFRGETIRLERPWRRLTMRKATAQYGDLDEDRLGDPEFLLAELKRRGVEPPAARDAGHLLLSLFEEVAEPHLIQPTFIIDHPVEVSPLAKQSPEDPSVTERFELYLGGMEIANAFSELNDPEIQAERFRQQLAVREQGDDEAHAYDEDYVIALEHGMPPAAGNGIGIDRLTMLLTDRPSIRDVILFPLMRPQAAAAEEAEEAPEKTPEEATPAGPEGEAAG